MKGKLSRMLRSGLAMMLAVIMMFSLGTAAFATEGNVADMAEQYEQYIEKYNEVKSALDKAVELLEEKGILTEKTKSILVSAADSLKNIEPYGSLVEKAQALLDEAQALMAEADALNAERADLEAKLEVEIKAAEASLEALNAKLDELEAELAEADVSAEEIEWLKGIQEKAKNDPTSITEEDYAKIEEIINKIDEEPELAKKLQAEIDAVNAAIDAVDAKVDELQAEIDALTVKAEELAGKADMLKTKADMLIDEAKEMAKDTIADLKDIAQSLYNVAYNKLDAEVAGDYKAYYISDVKPLALAKLDEVSATVATIKASVKANGDLDAAFKAELVAALTNASTTVDSLKVAVNDVNMANIQSLANQLVSHLDDAIALAKTVSGDDLTALKGDLNTALESAKAIAKSLYETAKQEKAEAITEAVDLSCKPTIAVVGDNTASTYAEALAAALNAKLIKSYGIGNTAMDSMAQLDELKKADIVVINFGVDSAVDMVYKQLNGLAAPINWANYVDDVQIIDDALASVEAELKTKFGDDQVSVVVDTIESVAYAYAKYAFETPALMTKLNEEALVVLVGDYNPLKNIVVEYNGNQFAMGKYLDYVLEATNLFNLANVVVMDNTVFVEIDNEGKDVATNMTSTVVAPAGLFGLFNDPDAMLPNAAGAEAIKNAIVNALEITTADHVWDNGTVILGDRYLKGQIKVYKCTICGAEERRSDNDKHEAYLNGYPTGDFRPDNFITRAEASKIFYCLLNEKYQVNLETHVYSGRFSDVREGIWYDAYVDVLADLGVITGYPEGTFRPEANITRAEFAAMAQRIAQLDGGNTENFPDVNAGDWFYDEVCAVVEAGIVKGNPDGTFRPHNNITRAEAVTMVGRMIGCDENASKAYFNSYMAGGKIPVDVELDKDGNVVKVVNKADINVMSDIERHWAFYSILAGSNTHFHIAGLNLG